MKEARYEKIVTYSNDFKVYFVSGIICLFALIFSIVFLWTGDWMDGVILTSGLCLIFNFVKWTLLERKVTWRRVR